MKKSRHLATVFYKKEFIDSEFLKNKSFIEDLKSKKKSAIQELLGYISHDILHWESEDDVVDDVVDLILEIESKQLAS